MGTAHGYSPAFVKPVHLSFYLLLKTQTIPPLSRPLAMDTATGIHTFPADTPQGQERLESPRSLGHTCHAPHHQPGVAYEPKVSQLRGMAKAQEETREGLPEKRKSQR